MTDPREQADCPGCVGDYSEPNRGAHVMGTKQHPPTRHGLESYAIARNPSLAPDMDTREQAAIANDLIGRLLDALHNYRAYYTDETESTLREKEATSAMADALKFLRDGDTWT